MRWRTQIRLNGEGVSVAADIDAAIAVNAGRPGAEGESRSTSTVRVVQGPRRAPGDGMGGEPSDNDQEESHD